MIKERTVCRQPRHFWNIRFHCLCIMLLFLYGCTKEEDPVNCMLSELNPKSFITALERMTGSINKYDKELAKCLKIMLDKKQYNQLGRQLYWLRHGSPPEADYKKYLAHVSEDGYMILERAVLLGYWVGSLQYALHSKYYTSFGADLLSHYRNKTIIETLREIFYAAAKYDTAEFKHDVELVLNKLPHTNGCLLYAVESLSLHYRALDMNDQYRNSISVGRLGYDLCKGESGIY